jgi:hypothetical protein
MADVGRYGSSGSAEGYRRLLLLETGPFGIILDPYDFRLIDFAA